EIIVMDGNFHGRTTTIVSFSTEPQYSYGFGPTTQGFRAVPFGDIEALNQAITPHTAAILLEPIQGEGGIIVPPQGWLTAVAQLCKQHNVLLLVDEIQTGLGRTGQLLACDYEAVKPDGLMLGKALGGGILAVSLFLARADVMDVFEAGDHGSTFGGNPLAARIGLEALHILEDEQLIQRAQQRGAYFVNKLHALQHPAIKDIRGKGLLLGLELHPAYNARQLCENLLEQGLLTKDTHGTVIRLAPPLVIAETEIDYAVSMIEKALADMSGG
ncbi:MAG TPA: aminotransferase class III-fold pyridoxal phosphate-dependent enzyme, partial [Agitococcus sp.]|nr:aminotransferase class III-fold pyridoxal phosphate-dependent enzyme [Agitococcus sp.]